MRLIPGLGNNVGHWRVLQRLAFDSCVDKERKEALVPYEFVWWAYSDRSHRTAAEEYIAKFVQDTGIAVRLSKHSYQDRRARTASARLSTPFRRIISQERLRRRQKSDELVYWDTGERVTRKRLLGTMSDHDEYLRGLANSIDANHPAYNLMQYLHSQATRKFEKIVSGNLDVLYQILQDLQARKERGHVLSKKEAWRLEHGSRVVNELDQNCSPTVYKPVKRCVRIFAVGGGILSLPKDYREILFSGCVEIDIKSSQLAIASKIFGLAGLNEFLVNGGTPWPELLTHSGLPENCKGAVKTAIYSLLYGRNSEACAEDLVLETWSDAESDPYVAEKLYSHRLIAELLNGRKAYIQRINSEGGAHDAFGAWISTDDRRSHAIMAAVAQSHELQMMLAILPVLTNNKQIYCMGWLHDGVTLFFGDRSHAERHLRQVEGAINKRIHELGFPTAVEVTHLPSEKTRQRYSRHFGQQG